MSEESLLPEIPKIVVDTVMFPGGSYHHPIANADERKLIELSKDQVVFAQYKNLQVGTIMRVKGPNRGPNNTLVTTFVGLHRGTVINQNRSGGLITVQYKRVPNLSSLNEHIELHLRTLRNLTREYIQVHGGFPTDVVSRVNQATYPNKLIDIIGIYFPLEDSEKELLLEETDVLKRINLATSFINIGIEYAKLRKSIEHEAHKSLQEGQKEYFLQEQIRQIHKELGHEDLEDEVARFEEIITQKKPKQEVIDKVKKEARRLSKIPPISPESGVIRSYLEWIVGLPWKKESRDTLNLKKAKEILDADHFDMQKVKDRILDLIAVKKFNPKAHGAILCFVGPPGTGKTSLGKSIAKSLSKKFVRISLGGVRDEAEIRGHRRTYIGALPGKIIQAIAKCGTANPVFLLDEIDKLGSDFRGDPSSALLEVLDPEQNGSFTDHYLELPFDLSKVLFIATANSLHTIPSPLLDRMEVIEIPGYSRNEKFHIAKDFLIPKQIKRIGMQKSNPTISDKAIFEIIDSYTRESGVRQLEREIGTTLRKAGREFLENHSLKEQKDFPISIDHADVSRFLGIQKFRDSLPVKSGIAGVANGLAWTEVGGKVLRIETSLIPGKEDLLLTGNLGNVMQESARIALSFIRANSKTYHIDPTTFQNHTIHIHVPQGAVPKDGPSAGISMTMALLSLLTNTPLLEATAMTGEITLTGEVTAIGGVKEKLLAAHRNNMRNVVLPTENKPQVEEDIPEEIQQDLTITYVSNLQEAVNLLIPSVGGVGL